MMKTILSNPELLVVGQKVKVALPTYWCGAKSDESLVWLPGKIIEINWGKDDIFKRVDPKYPAVICYIRASNKYKTCSLDRLQILPSQIEESIIFK